MTEREIRPALTEEEWAAKKVEAEDCSVELFRLGDHGPLPEDWDDPEIVTVSSGDDGAGIGPRLRHPLAALCLYGQPFGFTHDDVEALASTVRQLESGSLAPWGPRPEVGLRSLAARIAALLPPRKETPE